MLQNNVGSALKAMSEKMDSVPDLIKSARNTNKREDREEREIPTLGPLGSKEIWDFKTFPRKMSKLKERPANDLWGMGIVVGVHALALFAPFCMTPSAIGAFLIGYLITGLGITMSYHRQLTHKSFTTPKILEYIFAYCGASAV